jgi:hypothetical protein
MDMCAVGVLGVGRDAVGANSFSNKLALLSHLLCYRVQIGFILKSKTREIMSITFDLCSLKLSSQSLQIITIIVRPFTPPQNFFEFFDLATFFPDSLGAWIGQSRLLWPSGFT